MKRVKISRFVLSCIFLLGYAAYTVYAVYYYTRYEDSKIGTILLCLIGAALALNIFITIVSYRINLMDKPRPKLHRFIKMAKYLAQLASTAISLSLVLSAVHDTNVFSLIMAAVSVPFLIWGFFVNVIVEYFDRKFIRGFGKKVYIPAKPLDDEGNEIDMTRAIAEIDGVSAAKKAAGKNSRGNRI